MTDEPLFHVEQVKRCRCGRPCRPRQRNCLVCNAEAQKKYRARLVAIITQKAEQRIRETINRALSNTSPQGQPNERSSEISAD